VLSLVILRTFRFCSLSVLINWNDFYKLAKAGSSTTTLLSYFIDY
jgi:hypothetical protein